MSDKEHCEKLERALRKKSYDKLETIRDKDKCYLCIYINKVGHILINNNGNRKEFRHVWQIKDWIEITYAISQDELDYKKV